MYCTLLCVYWQCNCPCSAGFSWGVDRGNMIIDWPALWLHISCFLPCQDKHWEKVETVDPDSLLLQQYSPLFPLWASDHKSQVFYSFQARDGWFQFLEWVPGCAFEVMGMLTRFYLWNSHWVYERGGGFAAQLAAFLCCEWEVLQHCVWSRQLQIRAKVFQSLLLTWDCLKGDTNGLFAPSFGREQKSVAARIKEMDKFGKHGPSAFVRTRIPRPQMLLQPIQSSRHSSVCRYCFWCVGMSSLVWWQKGSIRCLDFVVLHEIQPVHLTCFIHTHPPLDKDLRMDSLNLLTCKFLSEFQFIWKESPNRLFQEV